MLIVKVRSLKTPFRKRKNAELGRLDAEAFRKAPKYPLRLLLDDVRSSHNVGSVFRTADAFRIEKIHLCGITARPPHKDIQKTALGATESVDWEYSPDVLDLADELVSQGYVLIAIEQAEHATELGDFKPESGQKYVFVLGHEVKGVRQELIDRCQGVIEIPQFGTKHSLNISVATGIVVWDYVTKVPGPGLNPS